MIEIYTLSPPKGSKKKRKRVGRGPGSGHGGTSCRGNKGQGSRSGGTKGPTFEGGQNPLIRRVPKIKGFVSLNRKEYKEVSLNRLNKFSAGEEVTPELLLKNKIVKDIKSGIKILGNGEIKVPLKIHAHKFSKKAIEKIKEAGGEVHTAQ